MAKAAEKQGVAATKEPRIPEAVDGIQVNFCKNPVCGNFGVPARNERQSRGGASGKDNYIVVGKTGMRGNAVPLLKCKRCGEIPTIKSNRAIAEELQRYLPKKAARRTASSCPAADCENHGKEIGQHRACYSRHGSTSSGASRYRCKRCGKVFTEDHPVVPNHRQSVHKHKNIGIFKHLVNRAPFARICTFEECEMKTVHQKVAFIYKQCRAFAAHREQELPGLKFPQLNISVDRQDYLINWTNGTDKRNITLHCIASADNKSSYIFGAHLDYDPDMDPHAVEKDAVDSGDYDSKAPFRNHARLWLEKELLPAPKAAGVSAAVSEAIIDKVRHTYAEALGRPDIEVQSEDEVVLRLPHKGMQVHSEYCLYGHFEFLKRMLPGCEKFVFYLDQESGIRAACHAAFWEKILEKRCDAFYVAIDKDLTIEQKRRLRAESNRELNRYVDKHPYLAGLHKSDIRHFFLKEVLEDTISAGKWSDQWLVYPFPDMSEPKKAVCWLTDLKDRAYNDDELAELYLRATLHGIDRFFMQARRLVMQLERPIATSSSARRIWNAYAPYNPLIVAQLVEIFRIYYNFVKVGRDKQTPAMRLGLAKGKVRFDDIIYFTG